MTFARDAWTAAFGLVAAGLAALLVWRADGPEDARLPEVAARPMPTLEEIVGLELAPTADHPGLLAARATPAEASGPLAVGGLVRGLSLVDVRLRLPPEERAVVRASRGRLDDGGLALDDVTVTVDGQLRLRAAAARATATALVCSGLTVRLAEDGDRDVVASRNLPWQGLTEAVLTSWR